MALIQTNHHRNQLAAGMHLNLLDMIAPGPNAWPNRSAGSVDPRGTGYQKVCEEMLNLPSPDSLWPADVCVSCVLLCTLELQCTSRHTRTYSGLLDEPSDTTTHLLLFFCSVPRRTEAIAFENSAPELYVPEMSLFVSRMILQRVKRD